MKRHKHRYGSISFVVDNLFGALMFLIICFWDVVRYILFLLKQFGKCLLRVARSSDRYDSYVQYLPSFQYAHLRQSMGIEVFLADASISCLLTRDS